MALTVNRVGSMTPNRMFDQPHAGSNADAPTPLWFQIASRFLLLLAAVLLLLSLGTRVYASNFIVAAFAVVFLAQGCAGFLYARAWFYERKRVRDTRRELSSIYRHVLDGILILDERGVCLDANPAAFAILGTPPAVLLGRSFCQFFKDPRQFERQWRAFLGESFQHGRTELVRHNGSKVVVNFTLTADYLPGRHAMILCDITERVEAQHSALQMQNLYQQMADSIDEVFWLLDAATKKVVAVNRAYETVTGRSLESIEKNPSSYEDLIHALDRAHVLAKLENAVHSGHFDEEFRIVRPDGEVRWVWAKASPVRAFDNSIHQLYGTALDITGKKLAEAQVAEHLATAEAARAEAESASAEAEALRRATLALTQNLRMDAVLDTLLQTLFQIVAYDTASVILTEENDRLFVAREAPRTTANRPVVTLETSDNVILQRALVLKKAIYVPDTREESEWREHKAFPGVRSWIAVPLVVSDSVLGLLSIGSNERRAFTTRHFHLAKLLGIPAAVAIHNARLYEWAQIYSAERQTLLKKLDETIDKNTDSPRERFPN
jgi:PAS domain S-box-containing protein